MTEQPLTHHEILGLIEPFARRGLRLDLAASNRIERRLVFKPELHAAAGSIAAPLSETLCFESAEPGRCRLTRSLRSPDGLEATLRADGVSADELLARLERIAPELQFRAATGYRMALSYRLAPDPAPLILTQATIQLSALRLVLEVPEVAAGSADIELLGEEPIELPEDLLAVLGWDWGLLTRSRDGWRASLRLRGREPQRSRRAESELDRVAQHLGEVLAEPPRHFHERRVGQRWRVVLRRAAPLLLGVALIAATAALPRLHLAPDSAWRMLLFNAPPLLLILVFSLREMPRLEIPPWPRAPRLASWRRDGEPDTHPTAAATGHRAEA